MWIHESNELWHNRHYKNLLFRALAKKKKSLTCACKQTLNGQWCSLNGKEKHLHPKTKKQKQDDRPKNVLFLLGSRPSQAVIAARQGQSRPIPRHHDETVTNQLILSLRNLQVAMPQDFSSSLSSSLSLGTSESHDSMVFISLIQSLCKTSLWTSTEKAERQHISLPSVRLLPASLIHARCPDAQARG